jgi:hypothetical protein
VRVISCTSDTETSMTLTSSVGWRIPGTGVVRSLCLLRETADRPQLQSQRVAHLWCIPTERDKERLANYKSRIVLCPPLVRAVSCNLPSDIAQRNRVIRWLLSNACASFPGTMQLLGSGNFRAVYHAAASSCDLHNASTRRTAVNRRFRGAASSPGLCQFPVQVIYATMSPSWSRGANLPARQRHEIAGQSCCKSGSRRIDPSINGGSVNRNEASRPATLRASGV